MADCGYWHAASVWRRIDRDIINATYIRRLNRKLRAGDWLMYVTSNTIVDPSFYAFFDKFAVDCRLMKHVLLACTCKINLQKKKSKQVYILDFA